MPIYNYALKEASLKVALFGPSGAGKKTTFEKLHASAKAKSPTDPGSGAEMSFSYILGNRGGFEDFRTRVAFHVLSNNNPDEPSIKALLRDVDAIIFTADSQWEQLEENVKSLQELERSLAFEDATLDVVPYILQYNKRDLPDIAPGNYMDFLVNIRSTPAQPIETSATTGDGIPALLAAAEERALAGMLLTSS